MVLGICGLGGSGKKILELVMELNEQSKLYDDIVFINKEKCEDKFRGYSVYTFEESIKHYNKDEICYCISVGEPVLREKIYLQIKEAGYNLATIIGPGIHISESTYLGEGVIIRHGAYISVDAKIEDNVMISPNVAIGHDSIIGKHSVISSNSTVAGGCQVGERTFIALAVTMKQLVKIGDDVIVSIGTVVNKNVDDKLVVSGNPMKVIGKNILRRVFSIGQV